MYSDNLTLYGEDLYFLGYKVATLSVPFPTLLDRIQSFLRNEEDDMVIDELQSDLDESYDKIDSLERGLREAYAEISRLKETLRKIETMTRINR